jgi:HK97 family phage major capsid protein
MDKVGVCYATNELLEDQGALEAVIIKGFQQELAFMRDAAIVAGIGAGQPLGILHSPCLVTVAQETGQAADIIVTENIVKMYSRMHKGGIP